MATNMTEMVERMWQAHIDFLDYGKPKAVRCVAQLLDEVRDDERVIPALKCIKEIFSAFPREPEDSSLKQSDHSAVYRQEIVDEFPHRIPTTVIENLQAYMARARQYQVDHPTESPKNMRLDKRYSHTQQIEERLSFLRFWLIDAEQWLCAPEAKDIWNCLFVDNIFPSDQEACLEWFAEFRLKGQKVSHLDHKDFFINNILQMDPAHLTESGLKCFVGFFEEVNCEDVQMVRTQGRCVTRDLQSIGLDYLWRIVITGPKKVARDSRCELQSAENCPYPRKIPLLLYRASPGRFRSFKCFLDHRKGHHKEVRVRRNRQDYNGYTRVRRALQKLGGT